MAKVMLRRGAAPRRPGVVFFGVFVLPVAAWLLYNYWDKPLTPGAQAVLDARPAPVPEAENLFLAMVAFAIAGDEPAHERGAAALAAYDRAVSKGGDAKQSYAKAMDRLSAHVDEEGVALCSTGTVAGSYQCLEASRKQRAAFAPLVQKLTPLLLRYRELESYPQYSDVRVPNVDAEIFASVPFRVALVNLSIIALAMEEGTVEPAAVALAQSAALWRRVLAAHDAALIDKMVASRAYAAHLMFASEFLRDHPPLEGPALEAIGSILRPLGDAERSIAGGLAVEFRMQAVGWHQITDPNDSVVRKDFPDTSQWWYRFLIKKNDSINRTFRDLEDTLRIERAGCVEVNARVKAAKLKPEKRELPLYSYFYNPIGRVLHSMNSGPEQYFDYLGRQCNLVALQSMVGLQMELQRIGTSPDSTAAEVQGLASRFPDPNTGKAFIYDAKARTLGFEFIGDRDEFLTPLPLTAP